MLFDFLSSTFILVGLIGTILGFIQAVPHLRDATYDFSDFRDALAVSGMGIVWSVLLHSLVTGYRMKVQARAFAELQGLKNSESLVTHMSHGQSKMFREIIDHLNPALTGFQDAANRIDAASRELSHNAAAAGRPSQPRPAT